MFSGTCSQGSDTLVIIWSLQTRTRTFGEVSTFGEDDTDGEQWGENPAQLGGQRLCFHPIAELSDGQRGHTLRL